MGNKGSRKKAKSSYEITIKTGDVKGDGTDANVYIILIDGNGNKSNDIHLKCNCDFLNGKHDAGSTESFKARNVPGLDGPIEKIELWKDTKCDGWYVELVKVELIGSQHCVPFPCNRWIKEEKFVFIKYDVILPQFDVEREEQRSHELAGNRVTYESIEMTPGCAKQAKELPPDQHFSNHYKWDIGAKVMQLDSAGIFAKLTSTKWKTLSDTFNVYRGSFHIPNGCSQWSYDEHFGRQRVSGINPTEIHLCTEIPSKIPVTFQMVKPFLEGLTLDEAVKRKRIFIVDLHILHQMNVKMNGVLCAPIGLFYNTKDDVLIPIAIQLFQEPRDNNPVFLPNDPHYLWMLVKMFFNNAEAAFHQACSHLGFTHLVAETFCVAVHQNLSPSHPIFRLLAPHFLYLIAINSKAVTYVAGPGGWVDQAMTMARSGLVEIVKRGFEAYRLDVNGWLPTDLKNRGVDDPDVLPYYPYRDDALLIHNAIYSYVRDIVTHFYDDKSKLINDYELQNWAKALVDPRGFAVKGVAGDGRFENVEDLIKVVSSIIFICSASHAVVSFGQYDEYGYPPNYPAILRGTPPKTKDEIQQKDIMDQLPTRDTTINIMKITSIISDMGTERLGKFDVQYLYDPHSVKASRRFREELTKISGIIQDRNASRSHSYPHLNPDHIPNAVSI